jgi:hypothetical protein
VLVVFVGLLWLTGFFRPEEIRTLRRLELRRRPAAAAVPAGAPAEAVELGGEIVAVDKGTVPLPGGKGDAAF